MIDVNVEQVLSLQEASQRDILPRRRGGKRPHVATFFRWVTHGVGGVRLEAIKVGGTLCTSAEAIQRFCERLTEGDKRLTPSAPTVGRRAREQRAASDRVAAALA